MAEMTFSRQQQETDYGYLMEQRECSSAGRTEAMRGDEREVLADPVFDCAKIGAYNQTKQRTGKEKYSEKLRIGHGSLL